MGSRIVILGLLAAALLFAQDDDESYQGPSILSRLTPTLGERGGQVIDIRPYVDVAGVYDNGMIGVSVNSLGQVIPAPAEEGVTVGFGVTGTKRWQHDILSVDYRGTYTDYQPLNYFNGLSQFLGLNYLHIFSPKVKLNLRETAGESPYTYGQYSFIPIQAADQIGVPTNQLFDNPVYFTDTGVDLTWQKTARLSFSFGGDGFLMRNRSVALIGVNGGVARADVAYRATKKQTVDVSYNYTDISYSNLFGGASFQALALGYSIALTPQWTLSAQGGVYLIHSLSVIQVPIDPAIAAIVGAGYATVLYKPTDYAPLVQAQATRKFPKASLSMQYGQSVTPGNGVYLVSEARTGVVNYSYVGFKRFTTSIYANYTDFSAVAQQIGAYRSYGVGAGMTYKLAPNTFLETRYDFRRYSAAGISLLGNENRISVGLAFSPGPTPLAIW